MGQHGQYLGRHANELSGCAAASRFYLLLAAGLRLGVLPLHLPYASEAAIRRGFGSALRLISAGSSLILLARIPTCQCYLCLCTFSAVARSPGSYLRWLDVVARSG
jgi:hypothetical protein